MLSGDDVRKFLQAADELKFPAELGAEDEIKRQFESFRYDHFLSKKTAFSFRLCS